MNKERFYEALLESLPDMVWGFDKDYVLQVANSAFFDMRSTLYNSNLEIGDSLFKDVSEETISKWKPYYERAVKGERIIIDDTRIINNMPLKVRLSLNPVRDAEGNPCGCVGITYNINREAELENEIKTLEENFKQIQEFNGKNLQNKLASFFTLAGQLESNLFSQDDKSAMLFMINQELAIISQQLAELNKLLEEK